MIQNLAMTTPPIVACVMVKEREGNEIPAIVKEFAEHGYMLCYLKYKKFFFIIAIL